MIKNNFLIKGLIYSLLIVFCGSCNIYNTLFNKNENIVVLPKVKYIAPDSFSGISKATVTGDVPLAFTRQLFALNSEGEMAGGTNLVEQTDQVLENGRKVLGLAGTGFENLVRINVYLNDDLQAEKVLERIKYHMPEGVYPAITPISAGAARAGSMVSMDFVAVAPLDNDSQNVEFFNAVENPGSSGISDVAVLPPGRKIFISGQAERGEDLSEATSKTMQSLFATIAFTGATISDIVQIKVFLNPVEDAETIEEEIASLFRGKNVPPIISTEWLIDPGRVEIEIISSAPSEGYSQETGSHYAPTWMTQAPTYSRLVDIKSGGLLFTSGLYGNTGEVEEAEYIFRTLTDLLDKAGSDYDNLVKATYYPSTDSGRESLVNIRKNYYNPEKPPAASLIMVRGVGRQGSGLLIDFIAMVPE